MAEIRLVDTTLQDGQQSLWACRMPTEAMLPALPDIDAAGFDAAEFLLPGPMFRRAVADLGQDPWDWLRLGPPRARATPLRLKGGGATAFSVVPRSVRSLFLRTIADLGITTTRISNPWNDYDALRSQLAVLEEHGIASVVNLIYSVSPRHNVEYYARKAREAAELRPYRICLKDVGGLLTPEIAAQLVPTVVANAGGIPVEFHAHSNNGMAAYNCSIAAEGGVDILHTAIPPLADGASQPSVFDVVRNLRARGIAVAIDLEPLERVRDHLHRVAEIEGLPTGTRNAFDETLYAHQVPGGMISNLRFQLRQIGVEPRLAEVLDEIPRVREDLGYPIMVTPLSQFVGTQSVANVVTGERYASVSDEVIRYALGHYGHEAVEVMDGAVRERILDRPRAEQVREETDTEVDEPSLDEMRERLRAESDEDLMVKVLSGFDAELPPVRRVDPAGDLTYEGYCRRHGPVVALVEGIRRRAERM